MNDENPKCELTVVIPCYRSAKTLDALVDRISLVVRDLTDQYEIILVNDFSPDDTWQAIRDLMTKHAFVRGINLARNSGQQIAVLCGMEHAQGELIVTMDDDLQHAPEDIPKLLQGLIDADADVAIAALENKSHSIFRRLASLVVRFVSYSVLGKGSSGIRFSSFRAFPKWVADEARKYQVPSPVVGYTLLKVTGRATNVTVQHGQREDGSKSSYHPIKLASYFISILFMHSVLPLRFISLASLATALFAITLSVIYFVCGAMGYITVSGFSTIVVFITGFFAVIFYSIGILGLYLTRVMKVCQNEPLYHLHQSPEIAILERMKLRRAPD